MKFFLFSEVTVPESIPQGLTVFEAEVEWLVCKESCIPGSCETSLPLVVASSQKSSDTELLITTIISSQNIPDITISSGKRSNSLLN